MLLLLRKLAVNVIEIADDDTANDCKDTPFANPFCEAAGPPTPRYSLNAR